MRDARVAYTEPRRIEINVRLAGETGGISALRSNGRSSVLYLCLRYFCVRTYVRTYVGIMLSNYVAFVYTFAENATDLVHL